MNDASAPRPYLGVDERRRQLLDAAWEVMREGGAGALSLRAVAQRAGVAHRVVTYAFGTKGALIAALLTRESARAVQAAWSAPLGAETLERAVAAALRAHLADVRGDPRRHECLAELALSARSSGELADAAAIESAAALAEIGDRVAEWHAVRGAPAGGDLGVTAAALLAAADGLAQWWLATRDDGRADGVIAILAAGFAARGTNAGASDG